MYTVSEQTDSSITIQAGKKSLTFKTVADNDVNGTIIEERDIEAQKIAKKTAELNALFVDVGKLVEEQGGMIEEVGNNVDTAEEMTKEGLGQLEQVISTCVSNCCQDILSLTHPMIMKLLVFLIFHPFFNSWCNSGIQSSENYWQGFLLLLCVFVYCCRGYHRSHDSLGEIRDMISLFGIDSNFMIMYY